MAKFQTKTFVSSIDATDEDVDRQIDSWLNGLSMRGVYGVQVVGYVSCTGPWTVRITAKTWVLSDSKTMYGKPPAPGQDVSQPQTWEEPAIDVGDNEEK